MHGVKIYLRHRHDSGWRQRNWQIIIVQPSESNYVSFSTVNDLSAFSVSLTIGQNWISNNIQWSLRLRYQRRWTGWQKLMIQELWLIFPPLIWWIHMTPLLEAGPDFYQPRELLTVGEPVLLWNDLCITSKFHRSLSWVCKNESKVFVSPLSSPHSSQ